MLRLFSFFLTVTFPVLLHAQGIAQFKSDITKAVKLVNAGKLDDAEPIVAQLQQQARTAEHAESLCNLALAYKEQAQYLETEALLKKSLKIFENTRGVGKTHPVTASVIYALAENYCDQENDDEAEPLYRRALAILGANHPETGTVLGGLGGISYRKGRFDEAETLHKRALSISENKIGKDHPKTAAALNNLAEVYVMQERYSEAETLFMRALKIREDKLGKDHPETATILNNLGILHLNRESKVEAEPFLKRALKIRREQLGEDHPHTMASIKALESFGNKGQESEANQKPKTNAKEQSGQVFDSPSQNTATEGIDLFVDMDSINELSDQYRKLAFGAEPMAPAMRELNNTTNFPVVMPSAGSTSIESTREKVRAWTKLAKFKTVQGNYEEAEKLYKQAIISCEMFSGKDSEETLMAEYHLAMLYFTQGRYDEAESLLTRIQRIWTKEFSQDEDTKVVNYLLERIRTRKKLPVKQALQMAAGNPTRESEDIESEVERFLMEDDKTIERRHQVFGRQNETPQDVCTDLDHRGVEAFEQGNYPKSETIFDLLLKLCEKKFGKDHMGTAVALNHLATVYSEECRYAEAELLFERALEIKEKKLGKDDPNTAKTLHGLAVMYGKQGRYVEAESILKRALEIQDKKLGEMDVVTAVTQRSLGSLYMSQGRFHEAEPLLRLAELFHSSKLGVGHPETLISRKKLADVHDVIHGSADNVYIGIHRSTLLLYGEDHPKTLDVLMALAESRLRHSGNGYGTSGDYQAISFYQSALRGYEARYGKDHPAVVRAESGLAVAFIKNRRYEEAEKLLNHAIQVFERNSDSADNGLKAYRARAEMYMKTDRSKEAVADLKRAMDLSLDVRKQASGSDLSRALTFARYYNLFDTMVDWQNKLGDMNEAYEAMERSRAQSLQDLVNVKEINLLAGVPEETARKLRADESAALVELTKLEQKLMNGEKLENSDTFYWIDDLTLARKKYIDARSTIRSASPAYRLMIAEDRKPVPLKTVGRTLLAEKALALEYFIGTEKSYVILYGIKTKPRLLPLILDQKQAEFFDVKAGALTMKKLETILQNEKHDGVLQAVADVKYASANDRPDLKTIEKLAALWTLLVPDEQVREKIIDGNSYERLLVLPDGILAKLPFEMLVVEPDATNPQYMIDRGPITVYAPSASMYYNLKQRKIENTNPKVLTLGNPDYNNKRNTKPTDTLSAMLSTRFANRLENLNPLPWTEKETSWIADSCRNNDIPVTRFDSARSTEENVRKYVVGCKIVHLACHGLVENDAGSALFSTLALTVGNPNDSKNNGFLELAEMFELDLKSCELAVLSACDTNLGPRQHGEGTWSMGRGMLASGAKRVVTTNWQVADDASAYLSYHFIDQVNETPTCDYARALQEAKLAIRNDKEHPNWHHPYYWAPFVLIGPN